MTKELAEEYIERHVYPKGERCLFDYPRFFGDKERSDYVKPTYKWEVGQTAYLLRWDNCAYPRKEFSTITPVKIKKVSRKYVEIESNYYRRFLVADHFFLEPEDYSAYRLLFMTKELAEEYIERQALRIQVIHSFERGRWTKLTTEELRDLVKKMEE